VLALTGLSSKCRMHCVIPLFSPKALQARQARHVYSSSLKTLTISPSISHQRIPLHRQLSYTTRFTKPQVLNQAHRTTTSPAIPIKSPAILSHASLSLSHFSTKPPIMSDDAYMSFLDKANADLNAGLKTQQGTEPNGTETVDATTQIPTPLQSVDSYYISDTDEPFEPVSLFWKGAKQGTWPSPGT